MQEKSNLLSTVKRAITVTQDKLLYSFVLAILLFIFNFFSQILSFLDGGSNLPSGTTAGVMGQAISDWLAELSEAPLADDFATALVFVIAAIVLYGAYVFVANSLVVIKNEIVVDTNYSRHLLIGKLAIGLAKKILPPIVFAGFIAVSIIYLAKYWMAMLGIFVISGMGFSTVHYLLAGLAGLTLNIYIILAAAHFLWVYEEEM